MDLQIESPIPIPPDFVVKNGWKILSATVGAIPGPVSAMVVSPWSAGSISVLNRSSPSRPADEPIASAAFMIKFRTTCCN